jgi:hypothetical protein
MQFDFLFECFRLLLLEIEATLAYAIVCKVRAYIYIYLFIWRLVGYGYVLPKAMFFYETVEPLFFPLFLKNHFYQLPHFLIL